MITINHPKIASLAPSWAPFPGCSVIFKQFGNQIVYSKSGAKLFGIIDEIIVKDSELARFGFCKLPLSSYHVTVADVVNAGNIRHIRADEKFRFLGSDGTFKSGREMAEEVYHTVDHSRFLASSYESLEFSIIGINNRGGRVLVVELEPCGRLAKNDFERLVSAREKLSADLNDTFGLSLASFRPHISLGYFANSTLAEKSEKVVEALNVKFKSAAKGGFSFSDPALFSFEDMATFEIFEE